MLRPYAALTTLKPFKHISIPKAQKARSTPRLIAERLARRRESSLDAMANCDALDAENLKEKLAAEC